MSLLPQRESIESILTNVPLIPAVIRYYDDFSDSYSQVDDASSSDQWTISFDGRRATLDFRVFDLEFRGLIKAWCSLLLAHLSPVTTEYYLARISTVPVSRLVRLLTCNPQEIRSEWKQCHSAKLTYSELVTLKNFLNFLCEFRIAFWGPEWLDLVAQLPLPKKDKYASVRIGDVFLTAEEEAATIRHIDHVSAQIREGPDGVSDDALEPAAILMCSYQFGVRAKQIAMLEMRNIRIWKDGVEERPAVHLSFVMIKQRSAKRVFPMIRRVKREWAPLFEELLERAQNKGLTGGDHVFGRTPVDVSKVLADLTEVILKERRTVTELRHTAAQRLVDAGASEEELATFMGHSDLNTGLIYFRSSASQGERVNQALGVSAVYQRVVKIAHDRFISTRELIELKGDQQIAGVPHGIPIAGIGGCTLGQPSCPYNPIMSCYGCPKFMPVADAGVHKRVLEDLRDVMKFFYSSSRAERGSPAFQLGETISTVQTVLSELGAESNELLS
jgi:integrase